jgi:hypothetical protein
MSKACRARSAQPPSAAKSCALLVQTSTDFAVDLRRPPRIISVTRALRHALTRRCRLRNCALLRTSLEPSRPIAPSRPWQRGAASDEDELAAPVGREHTHRLDHRAAAWVLEEDALAVALGQHDHLHFTDGFAAGMISSGKQRTMTKARRSNSTPCSPCCGCQSHSAVNGSVGSSTRILW